MLSKKYRASRIDIEKAIKTGYSVNGVFLYAKIFKKDLKNPCFAIVVSKKVEKSSVGRHHIKRIISSVIEKYIKENDSLNNNIVVFFVQILDKKGFSLKIRIDTENILKKIFI